MDVDSATEHEIADKEVQQFRRFFLTRLGIVTAAGWLFAWPIPLLPHTVFWALLATAALIIGLTWGPRSRGATRGKAPTRWR